MAKLVRAKSPVRWLRRILLLLGLVAVAALGLMLAAFQFGRTDRSQQADTEEDPSEISTTEETITAGTGFDYVQWSQGRKVFRIRAERSQQDRDENAYLEQVTLDVFRQEEGEVYTVTSRDAKVNQNTWSAVLEGDVVIRGWDDLVLEARAIELKQGGQLLLSRGAVEFSYPPDIVGRASQLRLDRKEDVISLTGGVHVKTVPGAPIPMRLDCERLIYRQEEGMVRALDDVKVRRGDQNLQARILTLFMTPERTLQSLRAVFEVKGSMRTTNDLGMPGEVGFSGQLLEMTPNERREEAYVVQLEEGPEGGPAVIRTVDASGLARRMVGRQLEGRTSSGQLNVIHGSGTPLIMDEYLDFDEPFPLRQVCARQLTANFLANGDLGFMKLEQNVELRDESVHLSGGDQATIDMAQGQVEIRGKEVELYNERGDVASPHISYSKEKGYIHARDGVRARLVPGTTLRDTPFSNGEGPLHVESKEAFWAGDPAAFAFRGSVRAWRQQNLLLTEQLRGDDEGRQMSAAGGVKTRWVPERSSNRTVLASGSSEPIEVDAESLAYREEERLLIYTGDVVVHQEERTIACDELEVELTPDGSEAERMICKGNIEVDDPPARRRVRGDRAVYTVLEKQVEVYGDQVHLVDADNNTLKGRYLIYDLNAGTVHLQSRAPLDAAATEEP